MDFITELKTISDTLMRCSIKVAMGHNGAETAEVLDKVCAKINDIAGKLREDNKEEN